MPRLAKLSKKTRGDVEYWFTKAGDTSGVYFGRVDQVTVKEATAKFRAHLATLAKKPDGSPPGSITVGELAGRFDEYLEANRSRKLCLERRLHLERFGAHQVDGRKIAEMPAIAVGAKHLRSFLEALRSSKKRSYDPWTIAKHDTSIRACFRWGTMQPSAPDDTYLPVGHRPFVSVEKYVRPVDADLSTHEELPTPAEVEALLAHADNDIAGIHVRGRFLPRPVEQRRTGDDNPYRGFRDLLTVFHETGARTGELAVARVRDFHAATGKIVLRKHKTSKTLKNPRPREIVLGEQGKAIVSALCRGRSSDDPIFVNRAAEGAPPEGVPWTPFTLASRFQQVRRHAKVRESITIYSFRHLYISEALMHGVNIATVAKLAGTSVAMVERVYGHLAADHMVAAQAMLAAARSSGRSSGVDTSGS